MDLLPQRPQISHPQHSPGVGEEAKKDHHCPTKESPMSLRLRRLQGAAPWSPGCFPPGDPASGLRLDYNIRQTRECSFTCSTRNRIPPGRILGLCFCSQPPRADCFILEGPLIYPLEGLQLAPAGGTSGGGWEEQLQDWLLLPRSWLKMPAQCGAGAVSRMITGLGQRRE